MESILTSIKEAIGITEDYAPFDNQIVMHINSVFMELTQIGVGPAEGFAITGASECWSDFIPPTDTVLFEGVKTYMAHKVRLLFDPPLNASVLAAMERQTERLEWRLHINADT